MNVSNSNRIKFLYSYGGMIIPRRTDGKLCYVGGFTRVLAVDRSITFTDLMLKFSKSCECSMSLRCKLPGQDLDLLVTITSDDDLASVINEYDRTSTFDHTELKIRAVLVPPKSLKKVSSTSCVFRSFPPSVVDSYIVHPLKASKPYGIPSSPAAGFPVPFNKGVRRAVSSPYLCDQGKDTRSYLVHRGDQWQLRNNIVRLR